jgi:ABC-type Zn uptake system ZnuABC Zn-binding protein ZnuA
MTEIQQIRKRLEDIERKIANKYEYNIESLKEELEAITQQIYKAVNKSSKEDKEELDNLIMLKNIIKAKIERQQRL